MGTFQVGLLLIGTFALLLALSVPVSVSIIISSVVTMASTLSLDLGTFVASQRMVGGVDSFSLLAVPFYILCGVLMNTGGIAQKLIDFAKILVGRIPGGLAHTNILGNTLFGSLSGSSVAASVAIGGVLIPMEEKEGYDKKFAAAVNIASAPTGLIIPPSGILIIYPVLAGCSVVGMIMSGYIPGLMWALACMVVAYAGSAGAQNGGEGIAQGDHELSGISAAGADHRPVFHCRTWHYELVGELCYQCTGSSHGTGGKFHRRFLRLCDGGASGVEQSGG